MASWVNSGARLALLLVATWAYGADYCSPTDIHGSYGFQLAGTTTIVAPGKQTPIASVGRLTFDGAGTLSGTTSVNFNGLFLGNPTTGTYEIKQDCSMTINLQDTSGAFQHFTGKSAPGGNRVELQQADTGAGERGLMVRSADACGAKVFQGQYNFSMSGSSTPLASEGPNGTMSAKALVVSDGNGNITLTRGNARSSGTYTVDTDCFMLINITVSGADSGEGSKLRGVLVNGGKEILAIETDPRRVAAVRFAQ